MKTRLEGNKNGATDTSLEVVSVVLMRNDSDMTRVLAMGMERSGWIPVIL